ncbi:hypothetical protein ATANTOWER_022423 [Ataeniobius toweri]|uniref:Uncharacterized protein n=1 Tax=Ataeniobius toweri TaxID=208326 RepID=A0ABU7BI34_9TELE|nr:hypothetical protein [Ataeniobius toweri]
MKNCEPGSTRADSHFVHYYAKEEPSSVPLYRFCRYGPSWLPLLDQSASTHNESWEMMDREGYSRPILQIGQKKDTFVGCI